ncbi:MAG: transglutaminase domain-containing protein [Eubacterium sp.]|nr:transglutaminase domain-containing protein [Eubacterium sp.]
MKRSSKLTNMLLELVQILMVFLGVSSALTCTATSLELVYDRTLLLSILGVGALLFYALFSVLETIRYGKLYGIGGLLVFYVALTIRFREEIAKGVITVANSFLKAFMNFTGSQLSLLTYENTEEVSVNFSTTLVLVIVGVFLISVVSAFFYRKRRSSVFMLCTLPLMILPLYVGRVGYFIDVFTYLVILITVIGTRQLKTNSTDRRLRQKLSVILIIIGLFSGLLSYLVVSPSRYERNKNKLLETKNTIMSLASWDMEDVFTWIRAYFSSDAIDYGKIGKKAELNHTGRTLLKLSGDFNPNYGLYMKSYVANVYEDNKWSSNKKDAEYKQDLATLSSQNITPDTYHVQLRNDIGDTERSGVDNIWGIGTLHVRNLAFGVGSYAIPVLPAQGYITEGNGELKTRVPGIEYDEEYYLTYPYAVRRILMTPSEDLVDPVFWTTNEDKARALREFVTKYYLQVPDSLKGICDEFKTEYASLLKQYEEDECDISDVLRAVRAFISKDTEYSESPGKTPSGRDTVEYFLKENKKGYCTYYATAAAILLRSVGIPTRFVEGLYISPEELKKNMPEEISVPDYDCHAWIEVYDERYGFVTFETTPGHGEQLGNEENNDGGYSDGNQGGDGPAQVTPTPMVTTKPDESMEFEDIEGNEDTEDEGQEQGRDGGDLGSNEKEDSGFLHILLILLIVLIIVAAVAEGQRRIRRYLFRSRLSDMKNKRRRVRMTHRHLTPYFMHRGVKYVGQSSAELTGELTEALSMPEEPIRYYVDTIFHAAFGPDNLTEQQVFRFREVCDEICRHAYRDAGLLKKIYYMYIMVL